MAQEKSVSTDRAALVALYNDTDGPNWKNNTNWLSDKPIGEWYGVFTDYNTGRVWSLELGANQLRGSIPSELGNLSDLVSLTLSTNQLSGSIPAELGNLSKLDSLSLRRNQLSGPIPSELGNLSNLTFYFHLDDNQLSGSIPPELGNLSNMMWYFDLSGNQLSGSIPSELGNLSKLSSLYLNDNQLSGSMPSELGNLSKLRTLRLNGNQLSGSIPSELGDLSNLGTLDLSANQLSGSIPPELGNLSELSGSLDLGGNQLIGSIPSELGNLSNLGTLDLSANQLSGSIPPELGNTPSYLGALYLNDNQLSGSIPPELGNPYYLSELDLHNNQLSGSIPPELGNLSSLQYLNLSVNQLSGSIPPELSDLFYLTRFYIGGNGLTGCSPVDTLDSPPALPRCSLTSWYLHVPQWDSFVSEGGNANVRIALISTPTEDVTFMVTLDYDGDASATADDVGSIAVPVAGEGLRVVIPIVDEDSESFTVTVPEGERIKRIIIPIVDDDVDEDRETLTVTAAAATTDWKKFSDGSDAVTITITDDDTAGVTMSAVNLLNVDEGGSASYTVVLDSQPTADVTVTPSSGDGGAATVSPISHTFTPSGWNTPLTFTVSGVADTDTNDETVSISHSATSGDAEYAAVLLSTVRVAVSDTTSPGQKQEQAEESKYADLIARMYEWRNDPDWVSYKAHTDRWDRALLAFGEEVSDTTLTTMTAAEAQAFADRGWSRWVDVAKALREIEAAATNQAPTVSAALGDVTIVNQSGTKQVSLSSVFSDADDDTLTITAVSSDDAKVTVSVASDYSTMTVTAKARGAATITVTADDGNGGTVQDTFTVTVKAAPTVASAISVVSGLEEAATQDVSLSGVFSDADGDTLTVSATSSDETKATVSVASDGSTLTLTGVAEGTATITVTAQDSDGNRVSDDFEVPVARKYAALIAQMYQWRNDPQWSGYKAHTDRWDRALLAFGETVADTTLTTMTAAEAQAFADRGWSRWVDVAAALREIEAAGQQQQPAPNRAPTVTSGIADTTIVNQSGTKQVSLSGVFSDGDGDSLTITAASSDETKATASVALDGSNLTVNAQARGTATITVTADDGNGATVQDTFTVAVKAAPTVASALADVSGLEETAMQDVSLSGVFSDTDGDTLTITAASSDETKATVSAASDGSTLTLTGVAEGTATITVTAQDSDGNRVSDTFDVEVTKASQLQQANRAPTVSSAIGDATIINESGTHQTSLSGVFSDADIDSLTITAASSNEAVATVSVVPDYSSLTVTAKVRGTATITVTADDGNGATVSDSFTVTVKAAPVVASALADVNGMTVGASKDVSLAGVFSDGDGDTLTITTASSDYDVANAFAFHGTLTVATFSAGSATITVTAQDSDGNPVSDQFAVTVAAPQQQPAPNQAPTVASAIADTTIVNQSGTKQVSLSGVFSDGDGDSLTITAASSDETKATASVALDGSNLTVNAQARGTATITVTADDGNGATVQDTFTVAVKAAPTVASALADVSGLEETAMQDVSLSGVFSDTDGDTLTITAASSDETKATVSAASDGSTLTLTGVAEGTATITVTAQDSDGNRVSETFDVSVTKASEPEEQTSDIVDRYDANGDGSIDLSEYSQAVRDYAARKITYEEFMEVYKAYTGSG